MDGDDKRDRRRLADYFAVVGFDNNAKKGEGRVLQRFPVRDWSDDAPFIDGIQHFCQPAGWTLQEPSTTRARTPKFFVAVLTDINGTRHYAAILTFSEAVEHDADDEEKNDDEDEAEFASITPRATTSLPRTTRRLLVPGVSTTVDEGAKFAPKCLVLISRHDLPEVLRNCLGVIYTTYIESLADADGEKIRLETLVGNLLGGVRLPPPPRTSLRFSLGAGDRLNLTPPTFATVPNTGTKVATLFKQLGVRNVLTLFCAVMTELKIVFYSSSFNRLTEACTGLVALIYPMRYSHVFIPVLPSSLIEVLSSPTPYIIGVNAIHEVELDELLDVVVVDFDGGTVHVPENMTVHKLPSTMMSKAMRELTLVLHPDITTADDAFPTSIANGVGTKPAASLDKELRAAMLRLMVRFLESYRCCLVLVRIHPKPVITFHKAAFLGLRGLCDSEFCRRVVLDCNVFNAFVLERGNPWRAVDVFDEAYASAPERDAVEERDPARIAANIRDLAQELYRCEHPETSSLASSSSPHHAQKIPRPAEGASQRIHQPLFPRLDGDLVHEIIERGLQLAKEEDSLNPRPLSLNKQVPEGISRASSSLSNGATLPPRKLDVLRNCIASIFDNKIADAKKTFPAVISALKTRPARVALCEELALHRNESGRVLLEHQQFDMIVRLMNAALQDDSDMDEYGIALALLPLSTHFARNLAKGVDQFASTLIQDHAVWQNVNFWESSFFNDVQRGIKTLYHGFQDQNSNHTSHLKRSVLEMAAIELRNWIGLDEATRRERITAEENTVYSQAFVYINYMVSLLCPLDAACLSRKKRLNDNDYENAASNSVSNSMAESDSIDAESGFEEQEIPDIGQHVIKVLSRFVDKVCSESGVTEDHMKALASMIPTSVALHLEQLEAVQTQASRLPPIHKPKILTPSLLPGEDLLTNSGLRVYLLTDGRKESTASDGVALLPAEGALFLTTYRIIFKGTPIDPFAAEHTVTRFFPVSSLTKDKRFSVKEYLAEVEQHLKDGIQLRSNTFQLVRAAFDDEVPAEEVENFRKGLQRVQFPEHIFQLFAFRGVHYFAVEEAFSLSAKSKDKALNPKYSTIRGIAKNTLKNVGRVTGIQHKKRKASKYLLPMPNVMPTQGRLSIVNDVDENTPSTSTAKRVNNVASLERLAERSYYKDWMRLELIPADYTLTYQSKSHNHNASFRVSTSNTRYEVSKTLPALLLVPARVNDDSLRRLARCHKQSRLPTVTWKHPRNHALLLRGSGYHGRGFMGMIRRHQDTTHEAEVTSSVEAELYNAAITQVTPRAMLRPDAAWNFAGSELSIHSLVVAEQVCQLIVQN